MVELSSRRFSSLFVSLSCKRFEPVFAFVNDSNHLSGGDLSVKGIPDWDVFLMGESHAHSSDPGKPLVGGVQ